LEEFRTITTPDPPDQKRSSTRRALLDIIETLVIAVVLFIGINTVSARIRVDSFSMEPTLQKGDFVIVNKLAYRFGSPQRGDIVIFRYPPNPEEQYVKRLIGLPGERVTITGGQVYINGEVLSEPYLDVETTRGGEWEVPANSLFVLGDNRNNSSYSRIWGMVPLDMTIGRAVVVYWPPEKWGMLDSQTAIAAEQP
jgi:signal peptidase I